jgi:peptidylprolyl isomerase/peptidyl-prolyl cis-trans isomerase D
MGIMNKMRENTPIVLWVLVFAFGVIWVLQDSQVFDSVSQGRFQNIAQVDGETVSYEAYARALEQQRQAYQAQTGESVPPQLYDLYEQQVFDALVDDIIREKEMERLGVRVSDEEVLEMVLGEDPDPLIKQQFGDGTGGINRDLLRSVIDNPEARPDWIRVEEYLRAKRRREKFEKLIEATVRVSDAEVKAEYLKRNRKADVRYVALRYADIADDSVALSERELGAFYNRNKEDFRRSKSFDLQFVSFSTAPSAADSAQGAEDLELLREDFAAAEDDSLFLARNAGERPYSSSFFRVDELDPEVAEAIFDDPTPGRIAGPVRVRNQWHLIKITDVRSAEEIAVNARHILIGSTEDDSEEDQAGARRTAQDLMRRIRGGEDFAELAREYSTDPGSGSRGGDLGWFGPGRMVDEFEKASFGARVGALVGPVKTQFGYHIIEVLDRADREVQIADFVVTIRPSVATVSDVEERAADLQYFASESGDFVGEAAKMEGLTVDSARVEADAQVVPGLGSSGDIRAFLASAVTGDVSDVVELNDRFVVLYVRGVTEAGYREFEEVRAELEPRARLERKKELQSEALRAAIDANDGLDAVASSLDTIVRTANGVTQNNTLVPTLGREPRFVGAALGMAEGERSTIIEGENSAYVLEVTRVYDVDVDSISEAELQGLRRELTNRKRQQVTTGWLAELRNNADVTDFRTRFQ